MANTTTKNQMPASQKVLESLGLSPNEAKIYEALVERGESGVSSLSVYAKVHRRNAYDALERLIDKGLVFQIASSVENKYNAVHPDKLLELLTEQRKRLEGILPDLKDKFKDRIATEEVYMYRGVEGQKNIWRDVLQTGEDSYFIGAKSGWSDSRLQAQRDDFFKEARRKNIKFIQLFDHELKIKRPNFTKEFPGELEYRFLPSKYRTNSAIQIFGDFIVTYNGLFVDEIAEDVTFFVIRSKKLADDYRTWFQYMWDKSSLN